MAQYVYTMNRVGKVVPPKRVILKDISLSFFPGAKIGVLGLNGSGKSSLLKIMAGEDRDIEGEAIPMPNMRIGFLPQEPQLDAAKTVREAGKRHTGRSAELSTTGGTSDARFIIEICPEVIELGPVNASIHKLNEHIELSQLEMLPRIYLDTLRALLP